MCPNFRGRQLVCKKCASFLVILHSPSEHCQICIHVCCLRIEQRLVGDWVSCCQVGRVRLQGGDRAALLGQQQQRQDSRHPQQRPVRTGHSPGALQVQAVLLESFFSSFSHLNLMFVVHVQPAGHGAVSAWLFVWAEVQVAPAPGLWPQQRLRRGLHGLVPLPRLLLLQVRYSCTCFLFI